MIIELDQQTNSGPEIGFEPLSSGQLVTIGGYGVTRLNSFLPSEGFRRIGLGQVDSIDEKYICLPTVKISPDGKDVLDSSTCLPAGQDSGSPLIANGVIRGVFVKSIQTLNTDGSSISKGCFIDLNHPDIKRFLLPF